MALVPGIRSGNRRSALTQGAAFRAQPTQEERRMRQDAISPKKTVPSIPRSLRYVSDEQPGIRRLRRRSKFIYIGLRGRPITDARVIGRIRKLAIPPAYEDVWICPLPRGHIQATGRDARGRKQYRYHADWRVFQERRKFERLAEFGKALPRLRRILRVTLKKAGHSREKVLAAVVSLLDRTLIRVGNEEYARSNSSYGLTTLRGRHARVAASNVALDFKGKSGKVHHIVLSDARLARIVRRCQELPGQMLFQYLDDEGSVRPLRSDDVNEFLRIAMGGEVTARSFRTWGASVDLVKCWRERANAGEAASAKTRMQACVTDVARKLGNTPAVCRSSYLDPRIVEALESGSWQGVERTAPRIRDLSVEESIVLALLRGRTRKHESANRRS
ncbi:MAG: DNA topoisomerase IB [Tahibacter sp.]